MEKIVPPRLEDAGLEDCALPPESIAEAFRKAASAVRSRASSFLPAAGDEEEGSGCVQDPIPEDSKPAEDLIVGGDAVEGRGEKGKSCVCGGGGGLKIGTEKKTSEDEGPGLTEGASVAPS